MTLPHLVPRFPLLPLLLLGCLAKPLSAQPPAPWFTAPPNPLKADLTDANTQRKTVFDDQGLGFEVLLSPALVGRSELNLEAQLPPGGDFSVKLLGDDSTVEISEVKIENGQGRAKLSTTYQAVSREEFNRRARRKLDDLLKAEYARAKADADKRQVRDLKRWLEGRRVPVPEKDADVRERYAREAAVDDGKKTLTAGLNDLAGRRPKWVLSKDRAAWPAAAPRELWTWLGEYFYLEAGAEHLKESGFEFDSNHLNFRKLIDGRLEGLHLILSGKAGADSAAAKQAIEAFTSAELDLLRKRLTAPLSIRWTQASDPQDPNSQWVNGQRVACRSSGSAAVKVQGSLDPKTDKVDWWRLENYRPDADVLTAPPQPGVVFDPIYVDSDGARLRISLVGDSPVTYTFEFRASLDSPQRPNLEIHESPATPNPRFPY